MKRMISLLLCAALILTLGACGKKKNETPPVTEPAPQASQPQPSAPAVVQPVTQDVDYAPYAGSYQDSFSHRAMMDVTLGEDGNSLSILVHWGSSAMEATQWEMTARLEGDKLTYNDCYSYDLLFLDEGGPETTVRYENGSGYFTVASGKLLWEGAVDEDCRSCAFEKLPELTVTEQRAGIYSYGYEEEIGGESHMHVDYLWLRPDGTGYLFLQDVVKITWDETSITAQSGNTYSYTVEDDAIVLDDGKIYERTNDGLPDELLSMVPLGDE